MLMSANKQILRVLVIDDEPSQRKIVERHLQQSGFGAETAPTAAVIEADSIIFQKSFAAEGKFSDFNSNEFNLTGMLSNPANISEKTIIELCELERRYILSILKYTADNRERAAALLGISERTLYRRLKEYE